MNRREKVLSSEPPPHEKCAVRDSDNVARGPHGGSPELVVDTAEREAGQHQRSSL